MSSSHHRVPLSKIDWFKRSGRLAIADVVYVEGIGLCSHQPDGRDGHRVMDYLGYFYVVEADRLFLASREEVGEYWEERARTDLRDGLRISLG